MRKLMIIGFMIGFISGCTSVHKEKIELMGEAVKMVKELGVDADIDAKIPLRAGMHNKVEFGSDGEINIHVNVRPKD